MASLTRFPVVIVRTGKEQPPSGASTYYLLGANGTFLHKRVGIVDAVIPVESIPQLARVEACADLDVPRLPLDLFAQVWHFFRTVYGKLHAESMVLLFFDEESRQWSVEVPPQQVGGASVHYDDTMQKPGCLKAGTIHSHCDFGAFHSGGDHHDEQHFDGLHITVGHVDQAHPTVSVSVVVNGQRFLKDPSDYLVDVTRKEYEVAEWYTPRPSLPLPPVHPASRAYEPKRGYSQRFLKTIVGGFLRTVPLSTELPPPVFPSSLPPLPPPPLPEPVRRTVKREGICVEFPEGRNLEDYPFPEAWMEQVSKPVFHAHTRSKKGKGKHREPDDGEDVGTCVPVHVRVATPTAWQRGEPDPRSSFVFDDFDLAQGAEAEDGFDLLRDLPPPDEGGEPDPDPFNHNPSGETP